MKRLTGYVMGFESLKQKSAEELVDLALEQLDELIPMHTLIVEELCSRVHPGWESEAPLEQSVVPLLPNADSGAIIAPDKLPTDAPE